MANVITLCRIFLIVPLIGAFFINAGWGMRAALAIFSIAALTDFVDGRVARARGKTSLLGAALDPLADKLLLTAALILLVRTGVIAGAGVVAAIAIILREILISGLREAVSANGAALPVTQLAKWKTTLQLVAAGLLIAAAPNGVLGPAAQPAGIVVFWLAAILTLWTGADYSLRAARLLRQKDAGA